MSTFEHLQTQLNGLADLSTIVKTMKALSAANIRQYEKAAEAIAAYDQNIRQGLHVVLKDRATTPKRISSKKTTRAAVVFGSDHGLCGRFNEELAQFLAHEVARDVGAKDELRVLVVGARMTASLEHLGQSVEETLWAPASAAGLTTTVQELLVRVSRWNDDAPACEVHLFFNQNAGGRSYQPTRVQLMPVDFARLQRTEAPAPSRSLPTFTMDRDALLRHLVHQYLFVLLFRACAESQASEHASRLAAMSAAERNLSERLEDVTILHRRARQSAITAELLDVVGGFAAIAGDDGY